MAKLRIYTPITKDLCIATHYVKNDGELSLEPLPRGTNPIETIKAVQEAGGIVDFDHSVLAAAKGTREEGQFELTVSIKEDVPASGTEGEEGYVPATVYPDKVILRLGLGKDATPIFGIADMEELENKNLDISGTFEANTVEVIAALARQGSSLKIRNMHITADDTKHFTAKMIERRFKHDGSSAGDNNIFYPKPSAKDEQVNIRTLSDLDISLDGFSYIEIPIYKGVEAEMVMSTVFTK